MFCVSFTVGVLCSRIGGTFYLFVPKGPVSHNLSMDLTNQINCLTTTTINWGAAMFAPREAVGRRVEEREEKKKQWSGRMSLCRLQDKKQRLTSIWRESKTVRVRSVSPCSWTVGIINHNEIMLTYCHLTFCTWWIHLFNLIMCGMHCWNKPNVYLKSS